MYEPCINVFLGSQPKAQKPVAVNGTNTEPVEKCSVPQPKKKVVNINEPRVCKNKGCGKTYKEKDNHDAACEYHPGPAVFHDRNRGVCIFSLIKKFVFMYVHPDSYHQFILHLLLQWKCCDVHVKEFDEFMEIPPCTKGWHNADAV